MNFATHSVLLGSGVGKSVLEDTLGYVPQCDTRVRKHPPHHQVSSYLTLTLKYSPKAKCTVGSSPWDLWPGGSPHCSQSLRWRLVLVYTYTYTVFSCLYTRVLHELYTRVPVFSCIYTRTLQNKHNNTFCWDLFVFISGLIVFNSVMRRPSGALKQYPEFEISIISQSINQFII